MVYLAAMSTPGQDVFRPWVLFVFPFRGCSWALLSFDIQSSLRQQICCWDDEG